MSIFNSLIDITDNKEILGLTDELKALFVYNYFIKNKTTIVVLSSTIYQANIIYQNILNYCDDVLLFPMDDFLTSEALAISPEFKSIRLETLSELSKNKNKIIVTNLMGYLRFLPRIDSFNKAHLNLKINQNIKIESLVETLFNLCYSRETIVNKTGDMAVRGYVVDIYPINADSPYRIEFWGDQIDKIKSFDIDSQKSNFDLEEIIIAPNTEFITNKKHSDDKQRNLPNYEEVGNISTLFKSTVFIDDYSEIALSYEQLQNEIFEYNTNNNTKETNYMFDFYSIKNNKEFLFQSFDNVKSNDKKYYDSKEISKFGSTLEEINQSLNKLLSKYTIVLCLSSNEKIKLLSNELTNIVITDENNIFNNKINIIRKKIIKGYYINNYLIIGENDLYQNTYNDYKYKTKFKIGTKIKDIGKLEIGDYVVHSLYGVGKYLGIKTLNKNGLIKDYLFIQYRDDDKLYVPVEKIDFIHKYSSNGGREPILNKLNSHEWEKTKARVQKKISDIAEDLLKLYAAREQLIKEPAIKDNDMQFDFENDFIYEETKDQIKVIDEIKKDMESTHPMDRLLCGDVGYGKTEVAFRAAFKAINSSKQVALLCPTTILSHQHYQNAVERFRNFPVRIELINRFTSRNKQQKIISDLKEGKIDLLIGTHRLLGNDVEFDRLGLLIIDEEQRFGVKHKERIKTYKNNIDVLTLSATPIPRTLQMSLTGVRNLSLIETPPVNRYPIQTYVLIENKQIIKDAIYKELSRKGQVFVLYNHVENMMKKKEEIQNLVPNAKIITAHGQMEKTELENVMEAFINKEYDVLLCTTIIETGIDIPSVNTLIIMDSDRFGLSQLYQIRGRVGRSNKIAYCYLMYEKDKSLTENAVKRLKAIKEFTELGSGFSIAMRDLSIRGAGDILGSEQSGFIDSVGIELFIEMLNDEVNRQKGIIKEEEVDTQPLVEVSTTISDKIANEEDLKIEIHKKINEIDSLSTLNDVKLELEDRFGKIDETVIIYMYQELFEKKANMLNIKRVRQSSDRIDIILAPDVYKNIKVTDLFIEVTNIHRNFKFKMQGKDLVISLLLVRLEKHFIYYLLDLINILENTI